MSPSPSAKEILELLGHFMRSGVPIRIAKTPIGKFIAEMHGHHVEGHSIADALDRLAEPLRTEKPHRAERADLSRFTPGGY